ncbi:MAG: FAD/NAD(P)-binding protein [Gluconacetobacter diazotrophicus]|nr:FAD/NAD(P)-binding protein [Gluconacetobacter diazotrophicus]
MDQPIADAAPLHASGPAPEPSAAIAVIGAGFSGTLLTLHLLRQCPSGTRIVLIERENQFGRGPAYSTGNDSHLLNVPAAKMSAFHHRPQDFLDWLRTQPDAGFAGVVPNSNTFVPRRIFGRYVRHLLNREMKDPARRDQLELVRGDVVDIATGRCIDADPDTPGDPVEAPRGVRITLENGRTLVVERAVLAIGNFPPAAPVLADPSFLDDPAYRPDPWAPDALADLPPDAPVLLIGSGLTMVDTVVSLLDQEHRGPITALSRRGLLPHRHPSGPPGPPASETPSFPTRLLPLARFLRRRAERRLRAGLSWHPVLDELRPITTELWQVMDGRDRRRFLRHLRPWWDIHRHRLSPAVADRIDAVRACGQLRILAGRIRSIRREPANGSGSGALAEVAFRPRHDPVAPDGSEREQVVRAARIINCAGPGADYSRITDPLVRSLLRRGLVRPDPLSLGLDVSANCALLGRDGCISRLLFAIGPLTRGAFWEMTAVPDIRQQAEFLAGRLAATVRIPLPDPVI